MTVCTELHTHTHTYRDTDLNSLWSMVDRGLNGQPLETPRVNLKPVPALSAAADAAPESASAGGAGAGTEPTRKVRSSRVRSKSETPHAAAAATTPSDDRRPRAAAAARRHSRVHKEPAGGVFTRLYNHPDTAKHSRPRDPHASTTAAHQRHASGSAANSAARDGSRGDMRTRARHGATSMSPEVARRRAYPVAVGVGGSGVGPTTVAFGLSTTKVRSTSADPGRNTHKDYVKLTSHTGKGQHHSSVTPSAPLRSLSALTGASASPAAVDRRKAPTPAATAAAAAAAAARPAYTSTAPHLSPPSVHGHSRAAQAALLAGAAASAELPACYTPPVPPPPPFEDARAAAVAAHDESDAATTAAAQRVHPAPPPRVGASPTHHPEEPPCASTAAAAAAAEEPQQRSVEAASPQKAPEAPAGPPPVPKFQLPKLSLGTVLEKKRTDPTFTYENFLTLTTGETDIKAEHEVIVPGVAAAAAPAAPAADTATESAAADEAGMILHTHPPPHTNTHTTHATHTHIAPPSYEAASAEGGAKPPTPEKPHADHASDEEDDAGTLYSNPFGTSTVKAMPPPKMKIPSLSLKTVADKKETDPTFTYEKFLTLTTGETDLKAAIVVVPGVSPEPTAAATNSEQPQENATTES